MATRYRDPPCQECQGTKGEKGKNAHTNDKIKTIYSKDIRNWRHFELLQVQHSKFKFIVDKLDGVGLVDNRPSTLQHLKIIKIICDT